MHSPKQTRGLILSLLLAAASAAPLAAVEVRGIVRDIYKQPLAGITVQAGEDGRATTTNAGGDPDIPLARGIDLALGLNLNFLRRGAAHQSR